MVQLSALINKQSIDYLWLPLLPKPSFSSIKHVWTYTAFRMTSVWLPVNFFFLKNYSLPVRYYHWFDSEIFAQFLPICQCSNKYVDKKNIWFLRSHDTEKRADKQVDGQMEKVTYISGCTTYKKFLHEGITYYSSSMKISKNL